MFNLDAQIAADETQIAPSAAQSAAGIERLLLRGVFRSRIADTEKAASEAERLVRNAPGEGLAYLVRAQTRASFHLFSAALDDLDQAHKLGADKQQIDSERAAVLQAVGQYDEALLIRQEAAQRSSTFQTTAALATLHAERRDLSLAERFFDRSKVLYRGVSPFPLALLDFQRGHLWHSEGRLTRARTWYLAALNRLPQFVTAQGHLAEVYAASGNIESAIARLRSLVTTSDDPEFAALLARFLRSAGRIEESSLWLAEAAARYQELTQKHPEAFADHAAEFWLLDDPNPERALCYAELNLAIRKTTRARGLLRQARRASSSVMSKRSGIPGS